ncbi:MAG: ABC transporter ATP-binding protein, partial [Aestuariivirga sp.]
DNLAFPLRNRGISESLIDPKVKEIAAMLDLSATLHKRASGLTADGKQKISLGRGLVRSDVATIMFDEPLTVIDPHLKWQLRSKLKELFEKPKHTFVGHFIGSPGMNVLPCEVKGGKASFAGQAINTDNGSTYKGQNQKLEIGVRPEFVAISKTGIPADIVKVADAGRFRIVETRASGFSVKLLVAEDQPVPTGKVNLAFDRSHTQIYADGWIVEEKP